MPFRVSYHDIALRATASVRRDRLARAIERLSAAYREGRGLAVHKTSEGRAAYLVHVLPAHVCDLRRLFLDELEVEISRNELRVLALGAGPGTEALALAESWATLAARDGEPPGERLVVARVDRVAEWDEEFASLLKESQPTLRELDPSFGERWKLETPRELAADLASPLSPEILREVGRADLLTAANLLSEIEPRGTASLPAPLLENLDAIARAAKPGAALLLADRARAPGVLPRLESALAALVRGRGTASEVREREVRCSCALTRATKDLYAKVRLPTTKVEDRPISTTRTAFAVVRFP